MVILHRLAAFDWNKIDFSVIGTSPIDTTCTIWDVSIPTTKTQLIAHDCEVSDLAFSQRGKDVFALVEVDGSVRLFDLRNLKHLTIMYKSPNFCRY